MQLLSDLVVTDQRSYVVCKNGRGMIPPHETTSCVSCIDFQLLNLYIYIYIGIDAIVSSMI